MKRDLYLTAYSLTSYGMDQETIMRTVKEMGYDGVEGGVMTDEFLELLAKYDLKCVNCMLVQEPDGSVSEEYLNRLRQYNQNKIVSIPDPTLMERLMDRSKGYRGIPDAFGTFADAIAAAEKANVNARIAGQYGFQTMYHSHTHEWRVDPIRGEFLMDTYLRHSDENHVMELDVGWALTAGIDPIYWMKRWPGRIGALHIKSCNWALDPEALGMSCPVPMPEYGLTQDQVNIQQAYAEGPQGPMEKSICDWNEVIRAAESVGCHTFIIERERVYNEPKDMLICLKEDHDWIRKCMERD